MMGEGMGEAIVRRGVAAEVIGYVQVVGTMVGVVMGLMVGCWMVGLMMVWIRVVGLRMVGLWVVGLVMIWLWMVGFGMVVGFRVVRFWVIRFLVVGFRMVVGLRMVGLVMVGRWRSIMNHMVDRAWQDMSGCVMPTQPSRPKASKAIRPKAPCTSQGSSKPTWTSQTSRSCTSRPHTTKAGWTS